MPTLVDFDPSLFNHVSLLTSDDAAVRLTAHRLHASLVKRSPDLPVTLDPVSYTDLGSVREAVTALQAQTTALTLNLTGGTKSMALTAMLAAPAQTSLTCVAGDQAYDLRTGNVVKRQQETTAVKSLFALHGVHLTKQTEPRYDRDLLNLAGRVLRFGQQGRTGLLLQFLQKWNQCCPQHSPGINEQRQLQIKRQLQQAGAAAGAQPGNSSQKPRPVAMPTFAPGEIRTLSAAAREDHVYWTGKEQSQRGGWPVLWEPALKQMQFDAGKQQDVPTDIVKTPDFVMVRRNRLHIVEVKPSLRDASEVHPSGSGGQRKAGRPSTREVGNMEQHGTYQFGQTIGRFTLPLVIATDVGSTYQYGQATRQRLRFKFDVYVHQTSQRKAKILGYKVFPKNLGGADGR
jgi:hypothetical protein